MYLIGGNYYYSFVRHAVCRDACLTKRTKAERCGYKDVFLNACENLEGKVRHAD